MHKIQDFLGDTWRSYKEHNLDLTTAAFTTTAAIDIVKREGEKLASQLFPGEEGVPWWKMVKLISDKGYTQDNIGLTTEALHPSSHGRFIYASPALLLTRLYKDFRHPNQVSYYNIQNIMFCESFAYTIVFSL